MKNYQCRKCRILIQKDQSPNTAGCSNNGNHSWYDLSEVGSNNFQCRKCNLLLKSKNTPNTADCQSGGNHQWTKL